MLYTCEESIVRETERRRIKRQDIKNKVFSELQDKARHIGYKLVRIK